MILYHAPGGGLGHISRGISIMKELGVPLKKYILTCSKNDYLNFFLNYGINLIPFTEENPIKIANNIEDILTKYPIKEIFVDTFPAGLLGELLLLKINQPKTLICRILNIDIYLNDIINLSEKYTFPFYNKVYFIEPLNIEYLNYLNSRGYNPIYIPINPLNLSHNKIRYDKPYYLVSHTGDLSELEALIILAEEYSKNEFFQGKILISSNRKISNSDYDCIFEYPISPYYEKADKIFTGCGFNSLNELKNVKEKHYCIPFPRRYDNQFYRRKGYLNFSTNKDL